MSRETPYFVVQDFYCRHNPLNLLGGGEIPRLWGNALGNIRAQFFRVDKKPFALPSRQRYINQVMTPAVTDRVESLATISSVATRSKGPPARSAPYFFLGEWLDHRGLSDQNVANQLGIARETVWRWRVGKRQPRGNTLATLARILNLEPEQLWQSPSRPSLDAMLKDATDEERALVFDIVSRLLQRP